MGEMLKELGKYLYNLSLLIAGALIFGGLSLIGFVVIGSIFIYIGEKFKNKEDC